MTCSKNGGCFDIIQRIVHLCGCEWLYGTYFGGFGAL